MNHMQPPCDLNQIGLGKAMFARLFATMASVGEGYTPAFLVASMKASDAHARLHLGQEGVVLRAQRLEHVTGGTGAMEL